MGHSAALTSSAMKSVAVQHLRISAVQVILAAIILFCSNIDLLALVKFGDISVTGYFTIAVAVCIWLMVLLMPNRRKHAGLWVVIPFVGLMLYSGLAMFNLDRIDIATFQNGLILAAFTGLFLLSRRESSRDSGTIKIVGQVLVCASLLAVGGNFIFSLFPNAQIGMGPRSFAIFELMGLSWFLAGWRGGSSKCFWAAVTILAAIGVSLSRSAFVIAALLFPWTQLYGRRRIGKAFGIVATVLTVGALYFSTIYWEPLNDRFYRGDLSLGVGTLKVNASGRTKVWGYVWDSFLESPWLGQGPGSAQYFVGLVSPQWAHPHNDYLRLLHDYGILGTSLWVIGLFAFWRTTARSLAAPAVSSGEARIHLTALLATISLSLVMLTDNPLVYYFAMMPLAIIMGVSLGRAGTLQPQKKFPTLRRPIKPRELRPFVAPRGVAG